MEPAKALLLAGGYGTRLRPLTETTPKCLVTVGERPLLDYWVQNLLRAGVREAVVNTHYLPGPVGAYIVNVRKETRLYLRESYEPELLGSAGTVCNNLDLADGTDCVVLVYADNLSSVEVYDLIDFHRSHAEPITMLLFRAENPKACGVATLDAEGRIVQFIEKPKRTESDLCNAGVYVVDSDAYREIAAKQAIDLAYDVLPSFIGRMKGFLFEGYHRDIGTLESLEQARQDVRNGVLRC